MTLHRQVQTNSGVWVDEDMAQLLECVWSQGLRTRYSCQGGNKLMHFNNTIVVASSYIMFNTVEHALRFLVTTRNNSEFSLFANLTMELADRGRGACVRFDSNVLEMVSRVWEKIASE